MSFIFGNDEESIELHDGKQVAHDRLQMINDELPALGLDPALEADKDCHAGARKVIDLDEVERKMRRWLGYDEFVE